MISRKWVNEYVPPTFLPTYQHTYLPTYLTIYISTYLPTYPLTYLPNNLLTYLPTYLTIYLSTYLHTYLTTYLLSYIPTYLHIYLRIYLPTCQLSTYLPSYFRGWKFRGYLSHLCPNFWGLFWGLAVTTTKINIGRYSYNIKAIRKTKPILGIVLNFNTSSFSELLVFMHIHNIIFFHKPISKLSRISLTLY